ncbi:aminoglycoside phosphotransferase family protein [Peribacillus acanthi]|uniref:aminoglycoside phosphotransferase family protein n=1 Tax=Peribacillus acanthi TaxID=2171554 RepID=UPI000D3E9C1B|nr:aminoglycoside phosphotransferase family protein [Peribacillus acanthi]
MREKLINNNIGNRYGNYDLVRLNGGYTNETFLLKGTSPLLVIKKSFSLSQDFENEISCLKLLQESSIVPKFIESFTGEDFQITVMEFKEGENGQSIIDNHDLERTKLLYQRIGHSLAKHVHSNKYYNASKGIKNSILSEMSFDLEFIPADLIEQSKLILEKIKDPIEDWVLTHGDYGIHNVLYSDENELAILDWEWAEWGNPLSDIAWVIWFTKLHYPSYAPILNSLFVEEYQSISPIDLYSDKIKGYCIYKVWKILHKVKQAPSDVQKEWIRRLNWTIETDFEI